MAGQSAAILGAICLILHVASERSDVTAPQVRASSLVQTLRAVKRGKNPSASFDDELLRSFPDAEHCASLPVDVNAPAAASGDGGVTMTQGSQETSAMASRESGGFMDDVTDEDWKLRKLRHIRQMCVQAAGMTSCPDSMVPYEAECVPGCAAARYNADCSANKFWQVHYEPSFSCAHERRIGLIGEGGKWVCNPEKIRANIVAGKPCLVYSIGSNGQYDFEESVHNDVSPECEIHTIDMNDWSHYTSTAPPEYVSYHTFTVGPVPNTPVSAIVKELGHESRTIDIFKIDCEGCEWETYQSWFGEGVDIRQILVEIHGTGGGRGAHEFFKFLFDRGYVVFHKEPNTLGCQGNCVEYAFIRLSPEFSRADRV